jgi:hypothetical protein
MPLNDALSIGGGAFFFIQDSDYIMPFVHLN